MLGWANTISAPPREIAETSGRHDDNSCAQFASGGADDLRRGSLPHHFVANWLQNHKSRPHPKRFLEFHPGWTGWPHSADVDLAMTAGVAPDASTVIKNLATTLYGTFAEEEVEGRAAGWPVHAR
jgi:hypothetical protein